MIDLHMHSTCSDGTFAPDDLVREAKKAGLTAMALTDHDTVEGIAAARAEARRQGIAFLPGLEISAEYQPGTMHILGYGFDDNSATLLQRLAYVQRCRRERNPRIVERLNGMGMALTIEEVEAASGGGLVGRPHFAKVLLDKGYVQSRQEAFDRYLAKGQSAYVDKVRLSPEESIEAIHAAGGLAVLAHPLQLKVEGDAALEAILRRLKEAGLDGMECHYRNHTAEDTSRFLVLAEKVGLLVTGGSDFHGANRPHIRLGTGEGNLRVPRECWEALASRLGSEGVRK
jgi:predicted metal-dependent phosphoesterase TrpH